LSKPKIADGNAHMTEYMAPNMFTDIFILSIKRLSSQQHIHNTIQLSSFNY